MEVTIRDAREADADAVAALLGDLGFESRSRGFTKRLR
jgi:N-acetylglutamate synthase-like GNAT family acetyltransferase